MLIPISDELSYILYQAELEKEYRSRNGNGRIADLIPAEDSPYLLRPFANAWRNTSLKMNAVERDLKMRNHNINSLIIKCFINFLDMPYITPTSLYLSGVIDGLIQYSEEINKDVLEHMDVQQYLEKWHIRLNSYQTYKAYKEIIEREI
jgi:hypothetical protein